MKLLKKLIPFLDIALLIGLFVVVVHHETSPPTFGGWRQVVVHQGDSKWTIGYAHCPKVDTREVVDAINQRNHISNVELKPGEVLWVPTKYHAPGWLF